MAASAVRVCACANIVSTCATRAARRNRRSGHAQKGSESPSRSISPSFIIVRICLLRRRFPPIPSSSSANGSTGR